MVNEMIYCRNCNNRIESNLERCPGCAYIFGSNVNIESNVPIPEEKPKKSRARRAASNSGKNKKENPAAALIGALKFISAAQKKAGPVGSQFCHIAHNWAAAHDTILTVAHPIQEDLGACPQTVQFLDALSKIGHELSITQLTENSLAISSGAFRALVPCVGFSEVPIPPPDPQCAVIDNRVRDAIANVMPLATEGAPNATYASVLLQANSAVATNGAAILEAWHGIDLPPGLMLPKCAASALVKSPYALTGFGFSHNSATFYFENGSFIKTQLFGERYPNYQNVLEVDGLNPWVVPDEFFKAVRAVESFNEHGHIYFDGASILSSFTKEQASTYKIEGLPERMGFNAKFLLTVEHAFKKAHFIDNKVYFFGDNIRGALMGLDVKNKNYAGESTMPAPAGSRLNESSRQTECTCNGIGACDFCIPF